MNRATNNFFEGLINSTNPQYIPAPTQNTWVPPPQPVYKAPEPLPPVEPLKFKSYAIDPTPLTEKYKMPSPVKYMPFNERYPNGIFGVDMKKW